MSVDYALSARADARGAQESDEPLEVAAVYERHGDFVWRSLQQLGVRDADLDDVLQEVLVVVHRRLHTFNGSSKLTTWLFGICLRVASRYRRRAYFRWERLTQAPPELSSSLTPEDACAQRQAQAELESLLGGLSLEKRAVFVLFEVEGQSCRDIAELLDVPVGTIHSRLHAARKEVMRAAAKRQARQQRRGPR